MKSRVRIDLPEDLYRELERRAVPFVDTSPADVLMRLLASSPADETGASSPPPESLGYLWSLMEKGAIAPGDELEFHRPRLGDKFSGTVTECGWIELDDGRLCRSPSGAIMELVGANYNGYKHWLHVKSGLRLDELRTGKKPDKAKPNTAGTVGGLRDFVRGQAHMGKLSPHVKNAMLPSIRQFLCTFPELERLSVDDLDENALAVRFEKQRRGVLNEDTVRQYRVRFKQAVRLYREHRMLSP